MIEQLCVNRFAFHATITGIFTVRNEVAKVMFLQACVCPQGVCVSQHALQEVSWHALQQVSGGGVCIQACPYPGSRLTPKGEIEGDQVQAHTQGGNGGDQVQAHTQGGNGGDQIQAHTQGGNGGGSGPGPHSRGKLRGMRSRLTPKGEIEGDQVQAQTQGGNGGGSDPGPHPR